MLEKWAFCALGLALFAPLSLNATPATFPADPTSARFGIGSYVVERTAKTVEVDIKDARGSAMAALTIEFDTPEGILFTLEKGKVHLRMAWKSEDPTFSVTDMRTGASATRTVRMVAAHPITTKGSSILFDKYQAEITLAFVTLDQTLTNLGLYDYFFFSKGGSKSLLQTPQDGPPLPLVRGCPPSCTGAYINSGFLAATSKSRCCEIATQSANNACSNGLCLGCCRIIGCDTACIGNTDYGCICSVNGQACGESAFTCDETWPPECT
jgi:hypothetical protein